jgi:hypothetical protein
MWSELASAGEHRKRYRTPAFISVFDQPQQKEGSIWDLQGPVLNKLGRSTSSANDTTVPDGPRLHRMVLVAGTNSAIFFSYNTKKESRWTVCCRRNKGQNGIWIWRLKVLHSNMWKHAFLYQSRHKIPAQSPASAFANDLHAFF